MKLPEHLEYAGLRVKTRHILIGVLFAESVAAGALWWDEVANVFKPTHEDRVRETIEIIIEGIEKSKQTPMRQLPDPDPFVFQG